MRSAARVIAPIALMLALALCVAAIMPEEEASALDQGKLVPPGRLVVGGRKLSCGDDRRLCCGISRASPSPRR